MRAALQRFQFVVVLFGVTATADRAALAGTTPDWVGDFTDFNSAAWKRHWGTIPDDLRCNGAVVVSTCNWGYSNLKGVASEAVPNGGGALEVTYPAQSGPPSCDCALGGGQFYQDLKLAGKPELVASPTIDLKYWYRFPVGFDFGGMTAGKMPGLYGGPPGCGSGGQRCGGAWSTRYMWRGGSASAPDGQVYWYSENGTSGYGEDLGTGAWRWQADGKWHSIEQLLNFQTGRMTVWHDGQQVFQTTRNFAGTPILGVFFSTFHGGHETSWSPSKLTNAEFAAFSLSTEGPQTAPPPAGMVPDGGAPQPADAGAGGATGAGSSDSGGTGSGAGGSGGTGGVSGGAGSTGSGTAGSGGGGAGAGGAAGSGVTSSAAGASGSPGVTAPASGACRLGGVAPSDPTGATTVLLALMAALALTVARKRRPRDE